MSTRSATRSDAGDPMFARPWKFVMSAPNLGALPAADRVEIAFAGRSNVGKSSLINALLGQSGLARTSNTPGRTQELNFFAAEDLRLYLVDMPGYGFAKAPRDKVEAWTSLIKAYLRGRPTLARVLLLIDSRHGLKPPDLETMRLLDESAVSYQVVLTKADKIKPGELQAVSEQTQATLAEHPAALADVVATSAAKGAGINDLQVAIAKLVRELGNA